MSSIMVSSNLPLPLIGATDYRLLSRLAYQALSRDFDIAAELIEKLERPCVLPDDQVPPDVVRIGSIVTCEVEDGPRRTFSLVYPDDVDAEEGRISVLTPVGVALLGLRPGQAVEWFSRDGQRNHLTVVRVEDDVKDELAL
ncbi:nucleoside diphosphate kinase regulator [Sinorhizobium meliloti]|uniref:nucleoside diphosphate kinase regulator n=1 Tax=Rhizobium meliloti TaxID=382 RepID=UPI000B4A19EA|nr:nucleoside diphosphate kinase regulator [Sinorhizobium meliloti]ASP87065.1 transcription elongation factor GreAB [Sinorhizobium meliloti]ASP95847.1 transcription elongation factor GreAB [Sinorhizobium meliloti]MQW30921.1 nucleoside diphosphate kinase regulator [Sinorhizobium meliloti]MQX60580.1 nucleoside diphosphate kinase regulator [Sinorhizobium meliloti]